MKKLDTGARFESLNWVANASLFAYMSDVISLREQVAQAEREVKAVGLIADIDEAEPTSNPMAASQ